MPNHTSSTPASGLTRRAAVTSFVVGAGALVTACTSTGEPARAGRRRRDADGRAETDPDVALAVLAVAGERSVLDAVTATIDRHRDLAATLTPVLGAHRAHVDLLADAAPNAAAGALPSPAGTAPNARGVPALMPAALQRLSSLEQMLSAANKRHALAAESGSFARVLASMAASAAQHASVLGQPAGTAPTRR